MTMVSNIPVSILAIDTDNYNNVRPRAIILEFLYSLDLKYSLWNSYDDFDVKHLHILILKHDSSFLKKWIDPLITHLYKSMHKFK